MRALLYNRRLWFMAVTLVMAAANMLYMHIVVSGTWVIDVASRAFMVVDVLTVFLLPILLVRRRMWIWLVCYALLTLLVWVNVGYSRYFGTYLPFSLYTAAGNLRGFTANIWAGIGRSDLVMLATTTVVTGAYLWQRGSHKHLRGGGYWRHSLCLQEGCCMALSSSGTSTAGRSGCMSSSQTCMTTGRYGRI